MSEHIPIMPPHDGQPGRGARESAAPAGAVAEGAPAARGAVAEPAPARGDVAPDGAQTPPPGSAVTEDQVKAALRKVKDPELNLNILDLGLVYMIAVEGSAVSIDMSLTSPGCPSGPEIMTGAEQAIRAIPGVTEAAVNLVWTPFWSPERIEPRIRAYLGL
jgi:metal-sulfur cluster biosynthetic enzyme